MSDGIAAECAVTYDAPGTGMDSEGRQTMWNIGAIPWARVIVDTFLVAGMLLASSNFLSVR